LSAASGRWSVARLTLAFYAPAAAAMAVNLFFAGLLARGAGFAGLAPAAAVLGGAALGLPAAWVFARRMRRLMDEADAAP
jgi:hypothetical protein